VTGINTTNQSTIDECGSSSNSNAQASSEAFDDWKTTFVSQSLPAITTKTRQFAVDREWVQYHTPRNLLLALTGELGELAELFQWKGDSSDDDNHGDSLSVSEHDKVGQELADVTIYLCRLTDMCGVSLPDEMMEQQQRS